MPDPAAEIIRTSADGVGVVTLNRPDRLNSVTPTMAAAYVDGVARASTTTPRCGSSW